MIKSLDKQNKRFLLSLPLVVGIGHGYKEVAGTETESEALIILVKKKVFPDQLKKGQVVPKLIDGRPTDVIEVGNLTTHPVSLPTKDKVKALDLAEIFYSRTARIRPAVPGISIGHYFVSAGTFGAVVYDSDGQALILSNNHILANSSNGTDLRAQINDPILQPGPADGWGRNNNVIATLYRYVALKDSGVNRVDCALAKPLEPNLIKPEILGIGRVQGTTTPTLGLQVKKSGRTTGVTSAQIKAIDVIANVNYGNNRILQFERQILTTTMSASGDSGSLVVDSENRAVGLLFAGSGSYTIVNPIGPVLDLLKVKF